MTAAGWLSSWPRVGAVAVCPAALSVADGYRHAGTVAVLLGIFPIQAVTITLGREQSGLALPATRIDRRL